MIVMKFGGTSNQDAAAMKNVIGIVKDHRAKNPVVVISAIARGTNELEQAARIAGRGDGAAAEQALAGMMNRHAAIIDHLLVDAAGRESLRLTFDLQKRELLRLLQGVCILKELTPRTMDAICSYGERLSSRLIAAGLVEAGIDAVWVDAKEFMLTDESFGRALPVMPEVEKRLEQRVRPLLASGRVPVTQGFIGVTRAGDYTTMGRESSDFSASIIGAAMRADEVQIWTDVDGILTADPTVVPRARNVKRMSFEEAFELSHAGAKVLHPNTMLPVIDLGIPVSIRNSKNAGGPGTAVTNGGEAAGKQGVPTSIAFKSHVVLLTVSPRKRSGQYLFWEGIFSVLTRRGVPAGLTATSEYSMALVAEAKGDVAGLARDLEEFGNVELLEGKGSVCVVGPGIRGAAGLMERAFAALAGIPVSMISYGASALNLTVILDAGRVHDAVRRLHAEFFEREGPAEPFQTSAG